MSRRGRRCGIPNRPRSKGQASSPRPWGRPAARRARAPGAPRGRGPRPGPARAAPPTRLFPRASARTRPPAAAGGRARPGTNGFSWRYVKGSTPWQRLAGSPPRICSRAWSRGGRDAAVPAAARSSRRPLCASTKRLVRSRGWSEISSSVRWPNDAAGAQRSYIRPTPSNRWLLAMDRGALSTVAHKRPVRWQWRTGPCPPTRPAGHRRWGAQPTARSRDGRDRASLRVRVPSAHHSQYPGCRRPGNRSRRR